LRAVRPIVAVLGALLAAVPLARRLLARRRTHGLRVVRPTDDDTEIDGATGAVRSVQSVEVVLPAATIEALWSPLYHERLARTYWHFLSRATLGLVRVYYSDRERFVCLLVRPLRLLTFRAPEYAMDDRRGVVRWRIERGLLVARAGREGDGYLEIDVRRRPAAEPGSTHVAIEVEVANFYPAIASSIGRWIYANTQSRVHVLVTHGFLRSLARLDLEESVVGRFVALADVPEPAGPSPRERRRAKLA
jgi:hypothetical protein